MKPNERRLGTAERAEPRISQKELYRVTEAMALLSIGRSVIYELLRSGRLRSVREGRTRLIPASAISEYVALLEREADTDGFGAVS
ncbi:helix-turn-helix domain-containing protein [Pseudonocardia sp. CA-142604]|uniref:helix-turn-helix domain-containing protein n=1 Tax=Pseudonocardia sp. CA-142604 TaxID=3240024 RepID=UPI003D8A682F